jgi:hypothetical protein
MEGATDGVGVAGGYTLLRLLRRGAEFEVDDFPILPVVACERGTAHFMRVVYEGSGSFALLLLECCEFDPCFNAAMTASARKRRVSLPQTEWRE